MLLLDSSILAEYNLLEVARLLRPVALRLCVLGCLDSVFVLLVFFIDVAGHAEFIVAVEALSLTARVVSLVMSRCKVVLYLERTRVHRVRSARVLLDVLSLEACHSGGLLVGDGPVNVHNDWQPAVEQVLALVVDIFLTALLAD